MLETIVSIVFIVLLIANTLFDINTIKSNRENIASNNEVLEAIEISNRARM